MKGGRKEPVEKNKKFYTHNVSNPPVSLKLVPRKLPALGLGRPVLYAFYPTQDGPVQADDALSLEELFSPLVSKLFFK